MTKARNKFEDALASMKMEYGYFCPVLEREEKDFVHEAIKEALQIAAASVVMEGINAEAISIQKPDAIKLFEVGNALIAETQQNHELKAKIVEITRHAHNLQNQLDGIYKSCHVLPNDVHSKELGKGYASGYMDAQRSIIDLFFMTLEPQND